MEEGDGVSVCDIVTNSLGELVSVFDFVSVKDTVDHNDDVALAVGVIECEPDAV